MASKLKLTELLYPTSTTPAITINSDDTVTFGAPTTTITNLSATSITDSGNLNFTGTGNRIRGDFGSATVVNRVAFQTNIVNDNTAVNVIPNGTAAIAALNLVNNSDPTNSAFLQAGARAAEVSIRSSIFGTGTYLPMTFFTGGSEAMRITTDRNVGIGTISPTAKFQVGGTVKIGTGVATNGQTLMVNNPSGTAAGIQLFQDGNESWVISNPASTTSLTFAASGNERMRLTNDGNLLVGQTSWNFSNNGTQIAANGRIYNTSNTDYNLELAGSTSARIRFYTSAGGSGTTVGSITVSGSATTYATSSDYRLKENVAPMTGALATVAQLKPVTYIWKVDGSDGQGFIAHELQAVVPDAVTGAKDAVDKDGKPEYQGVDTSFLVATVVAALQELKAEFDAYKLSHP